MKVASWFLLAIVGQNLAVLAEAMFNKRGRPHQNQNDEEPPLRRLRSNIADLFLSNQISAQRTQELFQDAAHSNTACRDMIPRVQRGSSSRKAHRDILRRLLKGCLWPPLYTASIPVFNKKTLKKQHIDLAFLLPHEVVHKFVEMTDRNILFGSGGLSESARRHLEGMKSLYQCDALAISLWMDGTPCNYDRSQSLESVTIGFPGLVKPNDTLRVPFTVINKEFCVKRETMDAILSIFQWSCEQMACGMFPNTNHLGEPFQDQYRKKRGNQSMGYKAFLCEVKADWALLTEVFRFPAWNLKVGCCWKCDVTPETMRNFGSDASWRSSQLTHWDLMTSIRSRGHEISPLFSAPGVMSHIFVIDWLHCADLGVACDFLGNVFWHITQGKADKIRELYKNIQQFYKAQNTQSRLDGLTALMLRKKSSHSPKLRAKAAEARYLVPFAAQLTEEKFVGGDEVEVTIKNAAHHLNECYKQLHQSLFHPDKLKRHSIQFLLLYKALEDRFGPARWRVKPKFHLFAEACSSGSNPSSSWVYRDEDFGGTLANMSRRKGGRHTPGNVSRNVLHKFRAQNVISLLQ